jgi:ATP-dependent DNA helicase DinG
MIRANTYLDVEKVLGPGGAVSQVLGNFELRPQQVQMSHGVQQAMAGARCLVVEAGTGVGKSFAYLVPAIDLACKGAGKVIISTFTITLQEQLINKDVPLLAGCMPHEFKAVLAKGRSNYLCRRRLEFAIRRQMGLFDDFGSELEAIQRWAETTEDGSLSDMSFVPKTRVWDRVKSEHGNCRTRKCARFHDCFYWRARRRLENADIIVANHALLLSDLVLRQEEASILPDYRYVIIDEAHNLEHVAEEHFGIDIGNHRLRFLLDNLYNSRTHKGLLAYAGSEKAVEIVRATASKAQVFFRNVRDWYSRNMDQANGRCTKSFVDDLVGGGLKELRQELGKLAKGTKDIDEKFEYMRYMDLCEALIRDIDDFLMQKHEGYVYWVEAGLDQAEGVRLKSAAVNVGPHLNECLFKQYESVIMTSATLSADGSDEKSGFQFFARRIGLDDFDAMKLGSPFDYQKQVTVYVEKDLPEPNDKAFVAAAAEKVKKYVTETAGRAFVLFTSYAMLEEMSRQLHDWMAANNMTLLKQDSDADRSRLLAAFKSGSRNVLFGTDSFWQGVDVPGQALSNVIIVRLPFAVPDQPLLAGRLEQIRLDGGNPFYDYQLPSAIIKFKQGFGRLIRSKSDTGIVVVLDKRIVTKAYGRMFLAALPKCRMVIV